MRLRLLGLGLAAALLFAGADKNKKSGDASYTNDNIEVAATVMLDPVEIKQALGAELGPGYCIVKVTVTPKGEDKLRVDFDDFTILSHKDGQRSQPFQPSQIAGSATMVVRTQSVGGGGMMGDNNGPIWGGIGGAPRRGPSNGGGMGNSSSEEQASATIEKDKTKAKNPVMTALEQKMLVSTETSEPVSGYLYYPLEGKQKVKDLALLYKGQAGRFAMDFH